MSGGRPTAFRQEFVKQAYRLCLLGATDDGLAESFEVNTDTIIEWKHRYPEFSGSLTRGKTEADAKMAQSLYKRGMGYKHKAVKIFMPAGADAPVYAPYVEHYPPDTAAASLWLRNRQPRRWRERTESVNVTMTLEQLILGSRTESAAELGARLIEEHDRKRLAASDA